MFNYRTEQNNHFVRTVSQANTLQQYALVRRDEEDDAAIPRPVNVLDRERIPYTVYNGDDKGPQLPMLVFIDKPVQRSAVCVGACARKNQSKITETGLHRESNLLAAFNEGRTWIILTA